MCTQHSPSPEPTSVLCHTWCIIGSPRSGPASAPDDITAQLDDSDFLFLWLCADLEHFQKITDDFSVPEIGDKEPGKENESWGKWRVLHKWESESHLLLLEQNSNSEVRNEDRGRAVWKDNNSQLLCWRMPWLQTDWAINRPIIYSLLIAFVKVSRVLSHRSPHHLVSLHVARKHVSVSLCVHGHACESWLPACGVCVTWACQ